MTFTEHIELSGIGLIVSGDYEYCSGDRDTNGSTIITICSVVVAEWDLEIYMSITPDMERQIKELVNP
jgi:hypothetical protein